MIDLGEKRRWRPPIIETIATQGSGVGILWEAIKSHRKHLEDTGDLEKRRRARITKEISDIVAERVRKRVKDRSAVDLEEAVQRVFSREQDPYAAAQWLLDRLDTHGS